MSRKKPGYWATCWCGNRMRPTSVQCSKCKPYKQTGRDTYVVRDGTENKNPGYAITVMVGGKEAEVMAVMPDGGNVTKAHLEMERRFSQLAHREYQRALDNGHDMEPLQRDDGPATYIAMCWGCERFLAFDPVEAKRAYGKVTEGPCPERVVHGEARRRSEFERDTAQSGPGSEPVESIEIGHTLIADSAVLNTGKSFKSWVDPNA